MTIEFNKSTAIFRDVVGVGEAESLLEWLQKKPSGKVNLAACSHLHPANLQVLMAAKAKIVAWPDSVLLRNWLEPALQP
jgi:hypothetical protein